jgi:endonuclease/exonuclease/phosphatase family metal-dependent hydrolase
MVVSRLPATGESICVVTPSVGRKAAHLSVLADGRAVNVWSVHYGLDSSALRVAEVTATMACASNWPQARIIAGDFNAGPGTAELNLIGQTYQDAWTRAKALGTAANYPGNCDGCTKNGRIDYIFASSSATTIELKRAEVFDTRDAQGVMASDHKPLLAVYTLR